MELALLLIEENKRTKDPFLDLGKCGLTIELPKELFECWWLEVLNFSPSFHGIELYKKASKNEGPLNEFAELNLEGIERLQSLKKLFLGSTEIREISSMPSLISLQYLDLGNNPIKDISFLQLLTSLQELDLNSTSITDFNSLKYLKGLVELNLSDNRLTDISFLQTLTSLQYLDLSSNRLTDISILQSMTSLRSLNLSKSLIKDISFLYPLTTLELLFLSHNQIEDISFLHPLQNIQHLDLSFNPITDISFLQYLTNLLNLDLNNIPTTDFSFLQYLTNLQGINLRANVIADFSFLQYLTSLKSMDLSNTRIKDISILQTFINLQYLNLSGTLVTDISTLQTLVNLQYLDLSYSSINQFDEEILNSLSLLSHLELQDNPLTNIPSQIFDQYNCLTDLKNYFKDKKKESIQVYESKIVLIGNGRVGKTCLLKRLVFNSFNLNECSTHAIQLEEWPLTDLAQENSLEKVQLNIWDFGGQDIYHATHRYFLQTQALFVLVWDAHTEATTEQSEVIAGGKKIMYKNHPLHYWLSYIKMQSNDSPVIIVQTKRDVYQKKDPGLTEQQKKYFNVQIALAVECSKSVGNGFAALKDNIEEVVAQQITTSCTEIPAQWYGVRNSITSMQNKGDKQIALSEFEKLCSDEGLDSSSTATLLAYLHNSGVLYYKEGLFNNQIVIDQKWAINAVYSLFYRGGIFSRLHSNGRFTVEDLQEIWNEHTKEEQELFLSFMLQCEICFEVKRENNKVQTSFIQRKFIAPQLLPEQKPETINLVFDRGEGLHFRYSHPFLHAAIIQRFIVRVGFLADYHDMWNKGVLLKTTDGIVLIEAFPESNEILVRIKDSNYTTLLDKVRNELKEINRGEKDIRETVSLDGKQYVLLDDLRKHPPANQSIQAESMEWVLFSDYRIFLSHDELIRFDKEKDKQMTPTKTDKREKIYFSYAWRDSTNQDRERFVDELYNNLKQEDEYRVIRDKEDLEYKESISGFMKEIGRGDLVVVAISDKYLKSEYCMYELHELYLNSRSQLEELRKKIFPVRIESLELKKPKVLGDYMKQWYDQEKEWEDFVKEHGLRMAPAQQEKYKKIKAIASDLGKFLDFLADMNLSSPELLSQDDFAKIKEAIKQQAANLKGDEY